MAAVVGSLSGGDNFAAAGLWHQTRRKLSSHSFGRESLGRQRCGVPFGDGLRLELSSSSRKSVEVRVAADFPDSKPDYSNKRRGSFGYHPLEELSKLEKDENDQGGDGKLTDAEVARTVAEANWSAVVFSSIIADEDAVFGTEVQYLIDDQGDFYFEVEDDNEFLRNLSSEQIFTVPLHRVLPLLSQVSRLKYLAMGKDVGENSRYSVKVVGFSRAAVRFMGARQALAGRTSALVLIGFGNVDSLHFSELIERLLGGEEDDDDNSDVDESVELDNEDIEMLWEAVEDLGSVIEDSIPEDSFSSLGGWGGFETLHEVHPMEFAHKVSEAVTADHLSNLGMPARRLTISGLARPVTEDEEPYVQGIWYDRFFTSDDDEDKVDEDSEGEDESDRTCHSTSFNSLQSSRSDGIMVSKTRLGMSEQYSGLVLGKPLSCNGKVGTSVDSRKRIDSSNPTEKAREDDGVVLGNQTDHASESSDFRLDIDRDRHQMDEGGVCSRISLPNTDKIKQSGTGIDVSEGRDDATEYTTERVLPPGSTVEGDAVGVDWSEKPRSTFYKLEIMGIRLDRGSCGQTSVEARDFAFAEPDVLAHFSNAIMEKINEGGGKIESALKTLVRRCNGLEADNVTLVGVDCLGLDLRVEVGVEIRSVRVPFGRRATCEASAEKLLDQLLFPRPGQRRSRRRSPS